MRRIRESESGVFFIERMALVQVEGYRSRTRRSSE